MSVTFLKHFNLISEPRIERCKNHELIDILLFAISAVLSSDNSTNDIHSVFFLPIMHRITVKLFFE
ncbi:MAG: transposase family protein [Colwellia sp.]